MVKILPSILAADFSNLKKEIKKIEAYVDGFHMDIMDGHFVPNISFGTPILKSLRKITKSHFDTHLMIYNPDLYIEKFAEFSDSITVHYEAVNHLNRTIQLIKKNGCKTGVSLNPHTPVFLLEEILCEIDKVLLMSVNPGFTGQKFLESTYDKVLKLHTMKKDLNPTLEIMVDGGINTDNIKKLYEKGAETFIVGASIFHSKNPIESIDELKII